MLKDANLVAIILAAGESKRLKSPKQLLKWKGKTLLNHTINQLKPIFNESIIVVTGAFNKEIEQSIEHQNISVVNNKNWQQGMGSSIANAIHNITDKQYLGALITLCDMPHLNTRDYQKMLAFYNGDKIVATDRNKTPGVPAIFPSKYFTALSSLTEDYGAKNILKQENPELLNIANAFIDIDTKEDYQDLIRFK